MRDWPARRPGEIPSPKLVAAWIALGMAPTERIPLWAAHWLVDGHDGPDLRTLASLGGTDSHEVHDVVREALADCHTFIPDSVTAAARTAFTYLARLHADGLVSEAWIVDEVDGILIQTGYPESVIDLHLGKVSYCFDEWGESWGRPTHLLEAEVRKACAAQLAAGPGGHGAITGK
ncbi:hypothetical protein AB0N89_03715 [Amycolatopsis sp. NPDC089917]|uniref:hypothetical protein n=1 Tax=Amycolatopsis sp. NPDC089917 TaxID=3155187 RepID=UPI00341EC6E5